MSDPFYTNVNYNIFNSLILFASSLCLLFYFFYHFHLFNIVSLIFVCMFIYSHHTLCPSFLFLHLHWCTISLTCCICLCVCVAFLPCLMLGTCKSARNTQPAHPPPHTYIPTTHMEKEKKKMGEGWSHSHLSLRQWDTRGETGKE